MCLQEAHVEIYYKESLLTFQKLSKSLVVRGGASFNYYNF